MISLKSMKAFVFDYSPTDTVRSILH